MKLRALAIIMLFSGLQLSAMGQQEEAHDYESFLQQMEELQKESKQAFATLIETTQKWTKERVKKLESLEKEMEQIPKEMAPYFTLLRNGSAPVNLRISAKNMLERKVDRMKKIQGEISLLVQEHVEQSKESADKATQIGYDAMEAQRKAFESFKQQY